MDPLSNFDVDDWIAKFGFSGISPSWRWRGSVTGPRRVAIVEQIRRRANLDMYASMSQPTDLFVLCQGEPSRRDVTKVGGLPYRPRDKAWPCMPDGSPMTFLAQFRFVESADIMGALPGEFLLIFVGDYRLWWPDEPDEPQMVFEWYDGGLPDLVAPHDVPQPAWTFVTCYGIRYRTRDFGGAPAEKACYEAAARVVPLDMEEFAWALCRWHGMKIGGIPVSPQPEVYAPSGPYLGRFLCSLCTIWPSENQEYPWLNVPHEIADSLAADQHLDWRDGAIINFFLNERGSIDWIVLFW